MERVLLAGATGYLGRFILKELLQRDYQVKTLVRDAGKVKADGYPDLKICEAEITDAGSIKGCCDTIDVVVSTVGITKQKDNLTYMDVDYQGNKNLLEEAKKEGVSKFIYISVLNAQKMRNLKGIQAKLEFTEALKESGLNYLAVYPNGFFSDMLEYLKMAQQGRGYVFGSGK